MNNIIEYDEIFEKIVFIEDLDKVLESIKNTDPEDYGCEFGTLKTEKLDDKRVKITIPLKKIKPKTM